MNEEMAKLVKIVEDASRTAGTKSFPFVSKPIAFDKASPGHHSNDMSENPSREEIDAKLERTESRVEAAISRLDGDVREMRAEMQEGFKGARHTQIMTATFIGVLVAIGIAIAGYTLQRVDAMPGELRSIADSITGAITAAQSVEGRPQVIVVQPSEDPASEDPDTTAED